MNKLSPKELDLLERVDAKEELRPFFFRKAKGLKWFAALDERGYFDPAGNSAPAPAREEGYVSVPHWPVTDYLVATSPELPKEENRAYAERVLEIIRTVTNAAREQGFGNYRTWWQFSKIIQNIPLELITGDDLGCVDYWLDDNYDRGLVAGELGEKWLVSLLERASDPAHQVALDLLKSLFTTSFTPQTFGGADRLEAAFRFDKWHARRIVNAVAERSGQLLGQQAVQFFQDELQRVLETLDNDRRSTLWRRTIENHEQNHSADDVEDILICGLRDSLDAFTREAPKGASNVVAGLLESPLQIFKRIAIYTIARHFTQLGEMVVQVITRDYFNDKFRHEMWHLLQDRYPSFSEATKQRTLEIIGAMTVVNENDELDPEATAYKQAAWLAAIRGHDETLQARYQAVVDQAGAEPEYPDFSSYSSFRWGVGKSPRTSDELIGMGMAELIAYLEAYEDPENFMEPGIEGLVKALKDAAMSAPLHFLPHLKKFASLDSAYVYELIEAYSELWIEKKELPWDEVWQRLLEFCEAVIGRDEFWSPENSEQRAHFVANRHWVVGSIGRLIEAGTKSDEHAFLPGLLDQARGLLLTLLGNECGEEFSPDSDAVSIAINSPRGRCLEALINLALRSCRLADEEGNSHVAVWDHFQPIFEEELAKPDDGEYEFITLLVNYLPNFLYLSTDWVTNNLDRIFDRDNYQKWLCAMQAYAYVHRVYEVIYNHLKVNGHFIQALDDEILKDRVSKKIIQNIVIAYLNDYEYLEEDDSLIRQLFDRARNEELSELIWFVWTLRKKDDQSLNGKVMELWPRLLQTIDTESREGRKLASRLTTWSVFVTEVNDTNRDLILQIAAFAEEDYNSHELLESIARISAAQPKEAFAIWQVLLQGAAPDYPEEAIREALANFVASGDEGRRNAFAVVDEYIRRSNEHPRLWLQEILA